MPVTRAYLRGKMHRMKQKWDCKQATLADVDTFFETWGQLCDLEMAEAAEDCNKQAAKPLFPKGSVVRATQDGSNYKGDYVVENRHYMVVGLDEVDRPILHTDKHGGGWGFGWFVKVFDE